MRTWTTTLLLATALPLALPSAAEAHCRLTAQTPATYFSLSFPSRNEGFVIAERNSVFALVSTANAGKSWTHSRLAFGVDQPQLTMDDAGESSQAIEFVSPREGWLAGYLLHGCLADQPTGEDTCPNGLFVTHDRGKTWVEQVALVQGAQIDGFEFLNRQLGWIATSHCHTTAIKGVRRGSGTPPTCGYQQVVRMTTDGGVRWRRLKWSLSNVAAFHFRDGMHGWAITRSAPGSSICSSAVYVTSSGGRRWSRALKLASECETLASFPDPRDGWVFSVDAKTCGTGGCTTANLRTTHDASKSWTIEQSAGTTGWLGGSGFPQELDFNDRSHGWLTFRLGTSLATAGGIALTLNGGATWARALPCYGIEPGGAKSFRNGELWVAGTWVSYCSQPKGSGLFHSTDWGKTWHQVHPAF